jgi:hypothetical protein
MRPTAVKGIFSCSSGLLIAMLSIGTAAARGVETNSFDPYPQYSGTTTGTSVTLNQSRVLPFSTNSGQLELASIIGGLSFATGTSVTSFSVAFDGANETRFSWESSTQDQEVVIGVQHVNASDQATDITIAFGDSATSCPTETASLTIGGTKYSARNPCALSAGLMLPPDQSNPYGPLDTGALEFTLGPHGATLQHANWYLDRSGSTPAAWTAAPASAPEIDPDSAVTALVLLLGGLAIARGHDTNLRGTKPSATR